MKITLSGLYETKSLEFTYRASGLIELFSVAKELKFDGIDYCATIPDIFYFPQNVLTLSKKYAVPVMGIHAPLHLLFFTPSIFYKRLMKLFLLFPDCKVFNFHLSGFIHPLQQNGKNIEKLMLLAKKNNVHLTFESNPLLVGLQHYPKVTYDPDLFGEYCINHNLPMTFDTAHIAHCNYDIVLFFKKYHKQIKLIHLSDSIGSMQHLPLGKGNLPIKNLLKEIKRVSYNQLLTFEIDKFPKEITLKEKTETIRKSFDLVKKYAL